MVSRNTSTAGIAALITPSLRVNLSVEIWAGRTILTRPLSTTLPVPMVDHGSLWGIKHVLDMAPTDTGENEACIEALPVAQNSPADERQSDGNVHVRERDAVEQVATAPTIAFVGCPEGGVQNPTVLAQREDRSIAFQELQECQSWVRLLFFFLFFLIFLIFAIVVILTVTLLVFGHGRFVREDAVAAPRNAARLEHHGVARQSEGNARLEGKFLVEEENNLGWHPLQLRLDSTASRMATVQSSC
jgi:hypothetical protein